MAQKFIAMALEAVGALFLVAMGFVLHPAAGFGIAGGACLLFGFAVDVTPTAPVQVDEPVDDVEGDG